MKEEIKSTVAKQPSFFLYDPWSKSWTPEKHRYLVMSNGLLQNTGFKKRPAIEGSQQGQITKKGIRLDFV